MRDRIGTHHPVRRAAARVALLAGAAWLLAAPLAAAQGLFTTEQVARGREIYRKQCAICHREDLNGRKADGGPALRGTEFIHRWGGQSVGSLVDPARELMPGEHPGSLARQAYVDVIAYVLERNGAQAGKVELPTDRAKLKDLTIRFSPAH